MTLLERLRWLAPQLAAASDLDVTTALELAAPYRPGCLSPDKQEEAIVWYAAYLLSLRIDAHDDFAREVALQRRAGVTSERIGDDQRTFAAGADAQALADDPMGFKARWHALADRCKAARGSILVGHSRQEGCRPGYGRWGW